MTSEESKSPTSFPPWHGPFGSSPLSVLNSLTGKKEPFIPLHPHRLTWYICGPTVYDSAHLGHARAYVTFDIIRRILTDYFHYDVQYVMNITDLDDKIILRARKNWLLEKYKKEKIDKGEEGREGVVEDIRGAYEEGVKALKKRKEQSEAELREAKNSRQREEMEERIAQDDLKLTNLLNDQSAFLSSLSSSSSPPPLPSLLSSNSSILSDHLDLTLGSTVTDPQIFSRHSQRYEREFLEDMATLNVREASVITRVTEYIEEIIELVQRIVDRGVGYERNGSVYFSVQKFVASDHHYGKLSPASVGNTSLTAEAEGALSSSSSEKLHPSDFALWKSSKPGEPSWPSRWGPGRPGWHIECSAMASDVIGERMDVHSGGMDLKFPHHDNELAQSEAALGVDQWVNHFWHAGHLSIKGLKMSKSLKNFITIRQLLNSYSARQVRLLFLLSPWESGINFSEDGLSAAKAKETELNEFFLNTAAVLRAKKDVTSAIQHWTTEDRRINGELRRVQDAVHAALCDNFDYPTVMNLLSSLVQETNKYRQREDAKRPTLLSIVQFVDQMCRVFGLKVDEEYGLSSSSSSSTDEPLLDILCSFRDDIRSTARDFRGRKGEEGQGLLSILTTCDALRDERLIELGIRIEDPADPAKPSIWKKDDPVKLRLERRTKVREEMERKVKGVDNKLSKVKKDREKLEEGKMSAKEWFKGQGDKYGQWNEEGRPTHDREGKELGKSAMKGVDKLWTVREKGHNDWREKMDKNPRVMEELQEEEERLMKEKTDWEQQLKRLEDQ